MFPIVLELKILFNPFVIKALLKVLLVETKFVRFKLLIVEPVNVVFTTVKLVVEMLLKFIDDTVEFE